MRDLALGYDDAELHVVTFSPYPSDVLRPDRMVGHLIAPEERDQLLHELGGVEVHDLPFTKTLASMSAEAFYGGCPAPPDRCDGSRYRP